MRQREIGGGDGLQQDGAVRDQSLDKQRAEGSTTDGSREAATDAARDFDRDLDRDAARDAARDMRDGAASDTTADRTTPRLDGARDAGGTSAFSLRLTINAPYQSDYGRQLVLPPTFGDGPFTFEVWIRPDNSYPVGPTVSGLDQRRNWEVSDVMPHLNSNWWHTGNFLLDGHNNGNVERGTFSLQFYGAGRVRWLFSDGFIGFRERGGVFSVGAYPATTARPLLDGAWHNIACVRRYPAGSSGATLELWIDGQRVGTATTPGRRAMAQSYWNNWTGYRVSERGWFWGAEKKAALGTTAQYEDYKGLIAEMRFWGVARSSAQLAAYRRRVVGNEPGLLGWWPLSEGSGLRACDRLAPARCMSLTGMKAGYWVRDAPPLTP